MGRIFWSRFRVRLARALLIAGRDIIEAEELRWGLRSPAPSGRVPLVNPKCGARRR
jgi:hypothetical protein